ncbi:hypothetical protein OG21DRAFT_1528386 [Imleria badia]|nr:hypothetical protein OG21DRAFT_1528386 [Imleria badia]
MLGKPGRIAMFTNSALVSPWGYTQPEPLSKAHWQLNALKKVLTSTYQGYAVNAFHAYLKRNNKAFHKTARQQYYGKFCSIVQSSGTRKTCLMLEATVFKVLCTVLERNQPNWFEDVCKIGSPTRVAFFVDLENEYENVRDEIHTNTGSKITKKYYLEMVSSKSFPQAKANGSSVVIALDEAHVLHESDGRPFS